MKKVLVFGIFCVACAQASIVANGGFEFSSLPGTELDLLSGSTGLNSWLVYSTFPTSSSPVAQFRSPFSGLVPSEGSQWIDLTGNVDSTTSFGGIRQSISLTVGQTYLVSFDVGVCNGATCAGGVNVGSPVSVLARLGATSFTATNANATAGNQWMTFQFLFTATSSAPLLSFEGIGNTPANHWYIGLDNVAVDNVVPEPASFVLFGIGAAGLLAFARKRGR